jgi:hypothetical protein
MVCFLIIDIVNTLFYSKYIKALVPAPDAGTHKNRPDRFDIHMTGSHAIPRQAREQADFYYHTGLYLS